MPEAADCARRLRAALAAAEPRLRAISDDDSARVPAPGKWSPRQIIGHLIDSASNNHQRFVRAVWQDDLVFPGYEQDRWVELQRYQDTPWSDLLTLWVAFNRHIAAVMAAVPDDVRLRVRARHNLDEIATHAPQRAGDVTLDYFMSDYVDHLEHHLRQIPATHRPVQAVKGIPETSSVVIPRLVCRDPAREIDFCAATFDAVELGRRPGPDGSVAHALLTIGPAMIMIEAEWPALPSRAPGPDGSSPVVIFVYVNDVDQVVERAVARGAQVLVPAQNQFWGDRIAWIQDQSGHVWTVATRVEETTPQERQDRWAGIVRNRSTE